MRKKSLILCFPILLTSCSLFVKNTTRTPDQVSHLIANNGVTSWQVANGTLHTCGLDETEVSCWGYHSKESAVPDLDNPRFIAAGNSYTCAIDDNGVQCWGTLAGPNSMKVKKKPEFDNPIDVSVGKNHACAIGDQGLMCWGYDHNNKVEVPPLSNPKLVAAGYEHTCAIDDNGVQCWGDGSNDKLAVPSLNDPKSISAGKGFTCVIDDADVKCWGSWYSNLNKPKFTNPQKIAVGKNHACAIDNDGMKCWGRNNESGTTLTPPKYLTAPTSVSANGERSCAINNGKAKLICWGENRFGLNSVPGRFAEKFLK